MKVVDIVSKDNEVEILVQKPIPRVTVHIVPCHLKKRIESEILQSSLCSYSNLTFRFVLELVLIWTLSTYS